MEFKVWVEGIQRVVCGVTEDTTCHDVVIALAHAIGRTGRFKLIEKWRENERLVPPSECPLKLLRSWGEYAGDVQYMLKCSGENSTRSSAGKSSYKSLRNEEKYLNNLAQHLNTAHSPPQSRRNVKRNLTFSGAHKSNILTPVKGQSRKPPLPPFENSSLDSVEEQSSLSSHSSSSPYSSFQSASSAKRTEDLGFPHIPERPRYDHFKIGTPAATSSTLSTPVTSPKVTLTNGEEDQLTDSIEGQDCRMPYENLRNKGRDCHMPYQNLENKDQDCQMPHQNFQTNNSGSHVDPHSYRNGIESTHSRFQHPKVLSQSAGVSELRMRFFNGSSDRDALTSNSISNPKNSDYSSLSVSHNNRLPTSRLKTNETVSEKKDHKGYHASSQISGQQSQKDDNDSKISLSRINQHSSGSNHVDNQSYSMSSGMHLNENPSHQQHLSSVHFTETDENRNTKKDLSALLGRGDLNGISRDDLVRLVNLQIERLNAQEDQLKLLESEIQGCGQGDADELESVTGECESLAQREQNMEGEIEELEIVSWQDKLELEQKQYQKLTAQLETIQQNLSKCEAEFGSHTEKSTELLSSIKAEETLNCSLESEAKEKEQVMLKEVSNLQQQLNQSVQDHEANEKTLESLEVEVKALESSLSEKNMEISQVEKELKQSNLQVFVLKPMVNNSTVGESMEKSHSGRHTSESDIPFTRSSSSRAGNARKIPTTAMALKEALETEPQGYWV